MAINATAIWRVRIGGNDNNGGAFDASIVGAGTDYTESDTPILALTDLATSSASATATSATGGFTNSMVGNAVRVVSGTNFTAGTYFITAVSDTNTVIFDRACSTAAASGGVANVGGAHANVGRPVAAGAVAGNVVMVRGQGLMDPIDIDYPNVQITTGAGISYMGYNGRPKVSHVGRCFFNGGTQGNVIVSNFSFIQVAGTYSDGVMTTVSASPGTSALMDSIVDTGGFAVRGVLNMHVVRCTFMNSGAQASTSTFAAVDNTVGGVVIDCIVKDQRGNGIVVRPGSSLAIGNVVQNCLGSGILTVAAGGQGAPGSISNNTVYGCGGDGVNLVAAANASVVARNLIVGCGGYGINRASSATSADTLLRVVANNFWGNTSGASNLALGPTDTQLDPQFESAPSNLTPTNLALRYLGGVGALT